MVKSEFACGMPRSLVGLYRREDPRFRVRAAPYRPSYVILV
jgi:hypothetical protein